MAEEIRIEFTRFSAFYSPLIATIAGGFLRAEGLEPRHTVSAPGKSKSCDSSFCPACGAAVVVAAPRASRRRAARRAVRR